MEGKQNSSDPFNKVTLTADPLGLGSFGLGVVHIGVCALDSGKVHKIENMQQLPWFEMHKFFPFNLFC